MQSIFSITQLNYIWNKASLTDKMIVVYVTMRHVYMFYKFAIWLR